MVESEKLKVGDTVVITTDLNVLNRYMYQYAGKQAKVLSIKEGFSGGQIVKLDIDYGYWSWCYNDKLEQIYKI